MKMHNSWTEAAGGAMLGVGVALVVWLGILIFDAVTAPTFELRTDGWACTARHSAVRFIVVNKIVTPYRETICNQWSRK